MNAEIEIHDSELVEVVSTHNDVIVRLTAYVHRSIARPGIDAGSGWSQSVEMVFRSGVIDGDLPELPCTLDRGKIIGGVEYRDMIPLPCMVKTAVRLEARSLHGELVEIHGIGLEVKSVGEGSYVEEFPGV